MYVNKSSDDFVLSDTASVNSYCEILAPTLVFDGEETRGEIRQSGLNALTSVIRGIEVSDSVENLSDGLFKVKRSLRNTNADKARFKSIFELNTVFNPTHFVFPGFNYDISCFGGVIRAGKILSTTSNDLKSNISNTPTGLEKDGQPWVFAYDREGIPSATVSEDEGHIVAVFASGENKQSLESAASLIKNENGTYRHRIFHPVSEMPYTYARKNSFEPPLEKYLTLKSGEETALTMYIYVGEPKYKNYGTANVMYACARVFPFRKKPELTPEKLRDLQYSFVRFLEKDADGTPMFSGRVSDRLYLQMHSGELTGKDIAEALKNPENCKLTTFSTSYEIGWAGQGAMLARLIAANGFKNGIWEDVEYGEKCLDTYVSTQRANGLLFPRYGQNNLPDEERRLPDACNMGWALCEIIRSYHMFRDNGIVKENYYNFAVKLAEFLMSSYNASYGFPKTWNIDGTPTSTEGSIGGFVIMGLCEYHKETNDTRCLEIIKRAMDLYYGRDLDNFICTAGALDCACVDKETAYPFLEASLYLYELTKDKIWIERAEKAACYFFSWMFFYDCLYDENTDFSKYGYYTTGGTLISAEHNAIDAWGALLVDAMFRLWRITDNENYKLWAKMTWANSLLCITTEDTPEIHGNRRPLGSQNEGFFHARWTKYRPSCEERGHFNDNLQSWSCAWRLYTLNTLSSEDIKLLWENE